MTPTSTALSGQTTQDAASLTVNFTPTNPQLAINYVFASEEYTGICRQPSSTTSSRSS